MAIILDQIFDAYIADRSNPHSIRPCDHPKSLVHHLKAARDLWGRLKLKEFSEGSRMRVNKQVEAWRAEGLSAHTIRKRVSILKTAFRFAVANEVIKRRQEPIIELPPNGPPRERALSEEELAALLKAADHPDTKPHTLLFLELAIRCAQRKSAITALTWDLIDFEKRIIRFRDTQDASRRARSKKRRGNKPMDDELFAIMRYAYEARDCEWVISWQGRRAKNPYASVKALFKRAGLPDLRPHDLRRSSATFVHVETDGDLTAAANHIVDTEATTRKHYVVEDPRIHMRGMTAVSRVMDRARGETELN